MKDTLEMIAAEVRACRACRLHEGAVQAVPGEGPRSARVFFVGQAPGAMEDQTGRPFVGRAGQFLNRMLAEIGLERGDVYITSVAKHFPPDNRLPRKDEVEACLPFLIRQIQVVDPEIVVLMGKVAEQVLDHAVMAGRKVLVTVHPAAAMRFPAMAERMREDFRELRQMLGR